MKVVVTFYPIGLRPKDDYFKICADVSGGQIYPILKKSGTQIAKKLMGQTIHAHGRGLMFPEMSWMFSKRKIFTPHFNVVGVTKKSSIIRSRIWNKYEKVIALTDYAKKNFIKEGIDPKKIEVLPLPIDFKYYSKSKGGDNFRKKYGLGKREPFVLVVGLRVGKNIDVIARACKQAGIKCVMVGPKDKNDVKPGFEWLLPVEFESLRKDDNNIFTGKIPSSEIPQAIDASTIYANSSEHTFECFSLITYQCASKGKPMCLPDFGVFDSYKKSALFHGNKNHKQLARNITKIMENNKLKNKLSKNSKDVAREFEYNKIKKKYEEFYERIGYI